MKGDAAVTLRRFMRISVLTVGKIKEKYFTSAIAEYSKRLGRYCRLEIVEVQDEKTPDKAPEAVNQQIKDKEGERLLSCIREDAYVIALAIQGKELSSEKLAEKISQLASLTQALRRENADLRLKNAELTLENQQLSERMEGARQRVSSLIQTLPAAENAEGVSNDTN